MIEYVRRRSGERRCIFERRNEMKISELKFDEKGLIPAVVQDDASGDVLMVAFMNGESVRRTLESGTTWFWSRSRKEFWNKGATSGNVQKVVKVFYDCDADCLLVRVNQVGKGACHTGEWSCFYRELKLED